MFGYTNYIIDFNLSVIKFNTTFTKTITNNILILVGTLSIYNVFITLKINNNNYKAELNIRNYYVKISTLILNGITILITIANLLNIITSVEYILLDKIDLTFLTSQIIMIICSIYINKVLNNSKLNDLITKVGLYAVLITTLIIFKDIKVLFIALSMILSVGLYVYDYIKNNKISITTTILSFIYLIISIVYSLINEILPVFLILIVIYILSNISYYKDKESKKYMMYLMPITYSLSIVNVISEYDLSLNMLLILILPLIIESILGRNDKINIIISTFIITVTSIYLTFTDLNIITSLIQFIICIVYYIYSIKNLEKRRYILYLILSLLVLNTSYILDIKFFFYSNNKYINSIS